MQLAVRFLHQRNPELGRVCAIREEDLFRLRVVGEQSVDYNLLPLAVLEELESYETVIVEVFCFDEQFIEHVSTDGG